MKAEVKHKSTSPCSDLVTSHQQCTVNSAIQPHLSITTLPTDTLHHECQLTLAEDFNSGMFIQSINVQKFHKMLSGYVLLSS